MPYPWTDLRLTQAAEVAAEHGCASAVDVESLVTEVRRLNNQNREYRSLLDCTEFALEWLILHHVIEDGGADWRSKFDGSPFFKCDCSEAGGYMERDVNAFVHTEKCASGFEGSLPALYDQIKAALARAAGGAGSGGE